MLPRKIDPKSMMSSFKCLKLTQIRYLSYKKLISWYSGLTKPKPQEAPFSHIVQIGDPTLRVISDEIPPHLIKAPEIKFLINRMKNVMRKYNCVGLSAPQIGIPVRLFLVEFTKKQLDFYTPQEQTSRGMDVVPLQIFVNPKMKVIDYTKVTFPENCESIKGFHADVPRYKSVELKGYGEDGAPMSLQATDWLARIVQHEMDHLNGSLYTDKMDRSTLTCSCWQTINERGGKIELPYGAQ